MSRQYIELSCKEVDEAIRNYIQLRNPKHWIRHTVTWDIKIWKGKLESIKAKVQATDDEDKYMSPSPDYIDILEDLHLVRKDND